MNQISAVSFPIAEPLEQTGVEMATACVKIIIAHRGTFPIAGRQRTSFIVGSCMTPLAVGYAEDASCTEYNLPPWIATAVLGVSGYDLTGSIIDICDLPASPFLSALREGDPKALEIARLAYSDWSAGRGNANARLASATWQALQSDPGQRLKSISTNLGVSDRRLRDAVVQETGLSSSQMQRLIRLEKASQAVVRTGQSLAAIAHDAGYADQSHMNRDFLSLGGTTPAARRRAALSLWLESSASFKI